MFRLLLVALIAAVAPQAAAQQIICQNGQCRLVQAAPIRVATVISRPVVSRVTYLPGVAAEEMAILSDTEIASAVAGAVATSSAMASGRMNGADDREVGRRLALRLHLKRLQRQGMDVGNIREILRDDEKFEMLYQDMRERYQEPVVGGAFMDAIQGFLKFLIDNQDQIFAIIQKLITLFSAGEVASPYSVAADPAVYYYAPQQQYYSPMLTYGSEVVYASRPRLFGRWLSYRSARLAARAQRCATRAAAFGGW